MNCTLLAVAALSSASSSVLFDSIVKGTALLVLAAVAATILSRDSAATRHRIWLLALVATLVVPVLSALLPQWRVLPRWAGILPETAVVETSLPSIPGPADSAMEMPQNADAAEVGRPTAIARPPAVEVPDSRPSLAAAEVTAEPAAGSWNWINALPLAWAIGFSVLLLRLMVARWMLWNIERRATIIGSSARPTRATDDPLATVLRSARLQLGIRRPIALLIHPQKTIPITWGIFRYYLLLPAAARQWSGEQLRSVLLHELAHIRRRDTMAQLLAHVACALYWFNPLAWLAAWRLRVEGERACDDLVLASGVRPSAYAGHLLDVVAGLSPARGTQSCGLAMARKSSLEGRLLAVLSENLNRRGISVVLAAITLAATVGIVVPIAMLRAADEKPDEKAKTATTDTKVKGGETDGEAAAGKPQPKTGEGQALYKLWQGYARTDGKLPGALIGKLGENVRWEIAHNKGSGQAGRDRTARLEKLLSRFDATHDWSPSDAIALIDDVSAIDTNPLGAMLFAAEENMIRTGQPLPAALADAPWGKPSPDGLRLAWLLEPRAKAYPLGTSLNSHVLVHNSGKKTAIFCILSWLQAGGSAHDAKGTVIKVSATEWEVFVTGTTYRLAPGEYCETPAAGVGIGVGAKTDSKDWASMHIGAWIDTKPGDEVRFSPPAVQVFCGPIPKDAADLWGRIVAERVGRELPIPAAAAEREQTIRRVTHDLFGQSPTPEEIAAFIADDASTAQAKLQKRLADRPNVAPFTGTLPPGDIQFRVLAAGTKPGRAASQFDMPSARPATMEHSAKPTEDALASLDQNSTVETPQLLYLTWQKDGIHSTGKPIPHTLWDLDGKILSDQLNDEVLKKVGSFSVANRKEGELPPLVFVFKVDQRITHCPVLPVVVTANGKISSGMTARCKPTNGMNVSAAAPQTDAMREWPTHISLEIKYPVENITTIKTLTDIPDDPVKIAPGVQWYLDSTRARDDREAGRLREAKGKTAAVLQTSQDLADALISYEVRVYLRGIAAPLSSLYKTIIEPNGKLHEIDVSQAFNGKNAIERVEITRQRYAVRRIDNVPVRVDILPKTDGAKQP